ACERSGCRTLPRSRPRPCSSPGTKQPPASSHQRPIPDVPALLSALRRTQPYDKAPPPPHDRSQPFLPATTYLIFNYSTIQLFNSSILQLFNSSILQSFSLPVYIRQDIIHRPKYA